MTTQSVNLPDLPKTNFDSAASLAYKRDSVKNRQAALLQILADSDLQEYSPELTQGRDTASVHIYLAGYEKRLQTHTARLHLNKNAAVSCNYFENCPDLDDSLWNHTRSEHDWKISRLLRTWHACGDKLGETARSRILGIFSRYRAQIHLGGTENHVITRAAHVLLIDEILQSSRSSTIPASAVFFRWIHGRAHYGFHELNSPCYHRRSFIPLLMLQDYCSDSTIKAEAKKMLDFMVAAIALSSINGTRGGPWHRATSTYEITDGRSDVSWMVGHIFFGTNPLPEKIIQGACWALTEYCVPEEALFLSSTENYQAGEVIRIRGAGEKPKFNAYLYREKSFILGSFEGGVPFYCNYNGSSNLSNVLPWRLTLADPRIVFGPQRDLADPCDYDNKATALLQHRNVLYFQGDVSDYNQSAQRTDFVTKDGLRRRIFRMKDSSTGDVVLAGVVFSPEHQRGFIEVFSPGSNDTEEDFQKHISSCPVEIGKSVTDFSYTSFGGNKMECYRGIFLLDGEPFPRSSGYLVESKFMNSRLNSGLTEINTPVGVSVLDFRNLPESGTGLNGWYFRDDGTTKFKRLDQQIEFYPGKYSPCPFFNGEKIFQVLWSGSYLSDYTGDVFFQFRGRGTVSCWLNDSCVLEGARIGEDLREALIKVSLVKGVRTPIRIHYCAASGEAAITVFSGPSENSLQVLGLVYEIFPD